MAHISDRLVRDLEPPGKGNKIAYDDEVKGFGIRVTAAGAKAFILAYRFDDPAAGRRSHTVPPHDRRLSGMVGCGGQDRGQGMAAGDGSTAARSATPSGRSHGRRQEVAAARAAETYAEAVADYVTREQIGRAEGDATAAEVRRVLLREGARWTSTPVARIGARDIRKLLEEVRDGVNSSPASEVPREPGARLPRRLLPLVRRAGRG